MSTHSTPYWSVVRQGLRSLITGLRLSIRHIKQANKRRGTAYVSEAGYFAQDTGLVTLRYPYESMAVPDNGRYRLHNEMDDCIVCDKCAKVCPVDCIDIEPIKSSEVINYASDGSPIRLYAARFDIDMAKCCFCGLCTTVCPTECLTMTKAYDFSEFDVKDMNYHFSNLSPEQAAEKKALYEQFVKEKEEAKGRKVEAGVGNEEREVRSEKPDEGVAKPKPAFKPTFKKSEAKSEEAGVGSEEREVRSEKPDEGMAKPKPAFKPTFKKPNT